MGSGDGWDLMHAAAGYQWCRPCGEHHRPPECPIDETGHPIPVWADGLTGDDRAQSGFGPAVAVVRVAAGRRPPPPVTGPCPHTTCPHTTRDTIRWGPVVDQFTAVVCTEPGGCAGACRAWVVQCRQVVTPWLTTAPTPAESAGTRT